MKFNFSRFSKFASVRPPVKNAKEMSKLTRKSGRRGMSPVNAVSSAMIVAEAIIFSKLIQ
jgi:hypothetical protein